MKRLNPKWIEALTDPLNDCPYYRLQGMKLTEMEWGRAVLEMDMEEKHLQPFGVIHGGVAASILDAAGFMAIFSQLDPSLGLTTVELKINYLAPGLPGGRAVAKGRVISLGRTLGLADAELHDHKGRLLAHATTTCMALPELIVPGWDKLPTKFLD